MRKFLIVAAVLSLVALAYYARTTWVQRNALPDGLLQVNGRMEGDHVTIASKFAGRVVELAAREGDRVVAGQVLIRLDDKQVQAQVQQARHTVAVDVAAIKAAQSESRAMAADIKASESALAYLMKQVPLAIERAEAELEHTMALAASADSNEGVARSEYERAAKLRETGAVAQEELDQKRLMMTSAVNDLTSAKTAVTKARKELEESRLGYDRIQQEEDKLQALRARYQTTLATIEQSEARHAASLAAQQEVQSTLDDLTITAPSDGTIVTRMADLGEVVSAGTPLLDLVDLDRLYLQVYVPEVEIGKVRLGLKAKIHTDAFPDEAFDATVRYIASEAEFTPKEVQTLEERVKLVFAVRLYLDQNQDHRLTPGLPADAVIRWKDDVPWARPSW